MSAEVLFDIVDIPKNSAEAEIIKELRAVASSGVKQITIPSSKIRTLLNFISAGVKKRRDKDTKKLRLAMYRAQSSIERIARQLEEQRLK